MPKLETPRMIKYYALSVPNPTINKILMNVYFASRYDIKSSDVLDKDVYLVIFTNTIILRSLQSSRYMKLGFFFFF